MYAIIETGGKQYKVKEGDTLFVEKLKANQGDVVTIDKVLAISENGKLTVGSPIVEGSRVEAKVIEQGKSGKVIIFKYKPKKDYRKKQGHRQPYTKLIIEKIKV